MIDKLNLANQLKEEIKELEWFTERVNCFNEDSTQKDRFLTLILKTKTESKFSIFGSRWYGYGSQTSDINIPNSLAFKINELAKEEMNIKINKLNNIIK